VECGLRAPPRPISTCATPAAGQLRVICNRSTQALFSLQKNLGFDTVALSALFDNYYSIID